MTFVLNSKTRGENHGFLFSVNVCIDAMKKKPIVAQIEEEGVVIAIELSPSFLDFYRKETGHSNITKKRVAKFLNHLIELHQIREC